MDDDDVFSLEGPVEKADGEFVLLIPLDCGGDQFIECSRGVSKVDGGYLKITIPESIVDLLRIEEGSLVSVDNKNGKLNIHSVNPKPLQ